MKLTNPIRINVPLFPLWFILAFAAICLVPWHVSPKHGVLPLGTPYVNEQMRGRQTLHLLMAHTAISIGIAVTIDVSRYAWRRLRPA